MRSTTAWSTLATRAISQVSAWSQSFQPSRAASFFAMAPPPAPYSRSTVMVRITALALRFILRQGLGIGRAGSLSRRFEIALYGLQQQVGHLAGVIFDELQVRAFKVELCGGDRRERILRAPAERSL